MKPIFVGTHDITRRTVSKLRDPEYRKKYEDAYREDFKKYGEELTLARANKILHFQSMTRPTLRKLWNQSQPNGSDGKHSKEETLLMKTVNQLPRKPLVKEQLLNLNKYLLAPENVDPNF